MSVISANNQEMITTAAPKKNNLKTYNKVIISYIYFFKNRLSDELVNDLDKHTIERIMDSIDKIMIHNFDNPEDINEFIDDKKYAIKEATTYIKELKKILKNPKKKASTKPQTQKMVNIAKQTVPTQSPPVVFSEKYLTKLKVEQLKEIYNNNKNDDHKSSNKMKKNDLINAILELNNPQKEAAPIDEDDEDDEDEDEDEDDEA